MLNLRTHKSLDEALTHGGINNLKVNIIRMSDFLKPSEIKKKLKDVSSS